MIIQSRFIPLSVGAKKRRSCGKQSHLWVKESCVSSVQPVHLLVAAFHHNTPFFSVSLVKPTNKQTNKNGSLFTATGRVCHWKGNIFFTCWNKKRGKKTGWLSEKDFRLYPWHPSRRQLFFVWVIKLQYDALFSQRTMSFGDLTRAPAWSFWCYFLLSSCRQNLSATVSLSSPVLLLLSISSALSPSPPTPLHLLIAHSVLSSITLSLLSSHSSFILGLPLHSSARAPPFIHCSCKWNTTPSTVSLCMMRRSHTYPLPAALIHHSRPLCVSCWLSSHSHAQPFAVVFESVLVI